jgi:hypothetical protein
MRLTVLLLGLVIIACASVQTSSQVRSMKDLVFLSRDGCANTPKMRANLDAALKTLKWATDYQVIDLDTLPASDVRTGYPTPTLLYKTRDIFGMPVPQPPYNSPT